MSAPLPRPAYPALVLATGILLALTALAAALVHSYVFASYLFLLAILPFQRSEKQVFWGYFLCLGTTGWVLFGLLPALVHDRLEGPYGGPAWIFAVAQLVVLLRAWVLARESVQRYAAVRWDIELLPPTETLEEVTQKALTSTGSHRSEWIDRAVAAFGIARMPEDPIEKRALLLNAYNVFSAHANHGRRSCAWYDLLEIYRTRYCLCGTYFSLDEIEHGLLRNNAAHPAFGKLFRSGDPALQWSVPLDARIHFALHCGARSCPPVRTYRAAQLDEQLQQAREGFLTAETEYHPEKNTIETSMILRWYLPDFGGTEALRQMLIEVLGDPALSAKNPAVAFRPYDWSNPEDL